MTRGVTRLAVPIVAVVAGLGVGVLIGRSGDHGDANSGSADGAAVAVVADESVDAGFSRDMSVHHAQAVAMGEAIRARTDDPELALLATDIVLTQQAQIGRFAGWLEQWGLPNASLEPPMAWAGDGHGDHDMAGVDSTMPGMATAEQVAALSTDPIETAERDFLTLMIAHHEGGVAMAEALLPLSARPEVERMAEAVIDAQVSEIGAMRQMLAERDA